MDNLQYTNIDELIADYLDGSCSEEQRRQVEEWAAQSEENSHRLSSLRDIWEAAAAVGTMKRFDGERAFAQFTERKEHDEKKAARRQAYRRLLRYAAAIAVLLCMVGYLSYSSGRKSLKHEFADIIVEAPQGSRTKMVLPDGTTVWLNSGSKIAYSQGFGVDNRRVKLTGEGYFEVKRNEDLPFSVRSENLLVSVLGTKFNFRDYPTDADAVVTLVEGKVALNMLPLVEGEQYYLKPNQKAVLEKYTRELTITDCTASEARQWTTGNLVLGGKTLAEIADMLERSYDVDITIKGERIKHMRFYGDFTHDDNSLEKVLEALAATGKIRYKINGRDVVVY